jgi:hypothetical protein
MAVLLRLRHRLPGLSEAAPVYSVIAFIVYSWAIVVFLWNLPAWLFYLRLDEILVVFAYRMVACLAESLAALAVLLIICFILPPGFLKNAFVLRGTAAAICVLGSIVLFWNHFMSSDVNFWVPRSIALAIFFGLFSTRIKAIASFLRWLSNSMLIFLYIFLPVSLVSLIAVLARNVF